ncbi:MAG: hypothetical protein LAO76_16100 [Acidobacteriia bacterium]|nr:hypothetical protein [Terriglobia bacterium]
MSSDTELFLIDESVLSGRVIPAISDFLVHGDSTAAKQLVREAISSQQFQTTLRSPATGDRMTAEYLANGSKELLEGQFPKEMLDDTGEIIRDREAIRRRQTETILNPFLVLFICSWSRNGRQIRIALSHGQLTDYLRSKSRWMDDMLGSSNELLWNAPEMPFSIGGEAKLLTKEEARILLGKLRTVPPPLHGSELIEEYEALRQLLQIAARNPRFRVLIRTT